MIGWTQPEEITSHFGIFGYVFVFLSKLFLPNHSLTLFLVCEFWGRKSNWRTMTFQHSVCTISSTLKPQLVFWRKMNDSVCFYSVTVVMESHGKMMKEFLWIQFSLKSFLIKARKDFLFVLWLPSTTSLQYPSLYFVLNSHKLIYFSEH